MDVEILRSRSTRFAAAAGRSLRTTTMAASTMVRSARCGCAGRLVKSCVCAMC